MEHLRHECKLHSRDTLPIILIALWADQRRSSFDKVRRTVVVVVVVVMRDLKQKISKHALAVVGISRSSHVLGDA
jgi:hypothetical protein